MADPKTKGMVALVPTAADAERLAVDGGLPVDEVHLTLLFLGDAADWDDTARAALVDSMQTLKGSGVVDGDGFALSIFNPGSDDRDTCIVLGVGGQAVDDIHTVVVEAAPTDNLPEQHKPFAAHVSLIYTDDLTKVAELVDRTGPITFDRIRVAFAGDTVDIPLGDTVALAVMPEPEPGTVRPALVTVSNVEVLSVGTWAGMTGVFTCTQDDLMAAVAAFDDPGFTRPVLKLGHVDPRFDGEPALGRLINPRMSTDGMTLIVDIAGVPTWLADIMADAFPSRSIEGSYRLTTQTGTCHKFALTALALLGVQAPAVSTLADLAARFGMDPQAVAAAAHQSMEVTPMPDPVRVAASVNLDTVRQSFYGDPGDDLRPKVGGTWSWVREVYNDFIVVDDDEGHLFQIPWSEDSANTGSVLWGEPSAVRVEYVPASTVAASTDPSPQGLSRGALRARLAAMPGTPEPVIADPAPGSTAPPLIDTPPVSTPGPADDPELPAAEPEPITDPKEDPVSADLSAVRSRLGLPDDTDDAAVTAAVLAELDKQSQSVVPEPPAEPVEVIAEPERELVAASTPKLPAGVVTIDESTLADLRRNAMLGAAAHERQRTADRDTQIRDAVQLGKIPPARVEHWTKAWEADPEGTKAALSALETGLLPVALAGITGSGEPENDVNDVSAEEAAGWASLLNIPAEELTRG